MRGKSTLYRCRIHPPYEVVVYQKDENVSWKEHMEAAKKARQAIDGNVYSISAAFIRKR